MIYTEAALHVLWQRSHHCAPEPTRITCFFYQVFEAKLNDMYMITMRALCITAEKCRGIIFCQNNSG
jgi:hypothetical protein